jgi:dephospho-CoA kinase
VTDRDATRPLRIGLVGPIGCGKSTVAARLATHGALVIDADRLARDVTADPGPALDAIVERFGRSVLRPDGSLDRAALGRTVFDDPAELRALEAIVSPAVRPKIQDALAAADGAAAPVVVLEAIRLVEAGYHELVDETWYVTCDPAVQRERLAIRGLDPAEAERRIASQVGLLASARTVATRIVVTDGDLDRTGRSVDELLDEALRARAAG